MKRKLTALSRRYVAVLRKHLREGPRASLQPAYDLGCQAAALDLETLDMARIHKRALAALEASSSRDGVIKRAEIFFVEAITPIEKTHRAALKANARLKSVNQMLDRRTVERRMTGFVERGDLAMSLAVAPTPRDAGTSATGKNR